MPKAKQPQRDSGGPSIKIPEGVSEFYANSLNILLTPWDFVLLFGSLALPATVGSAGKVTSEVRVDAAIRMSPQHAKASSIVMQSMVAKYEETFGEIPVSIEEADDDSKQAQLDSGSGSTSS